MKNIRFIEEKKIMQNSIKVVLIGDSRVGKTTFIKKLAYGEFEKKHIPTLGVEVHPFSLNGKKFNVWDCAGDPRFTGFKDGYYIQSDAAIIFADSTNAKSIKNIEKWRSEFAKVAPNAKVLVCKTKADLLTSRMLGNEADSFEISTKNKNDCRKPFLSH